jgi:mono/diheme cytochrome c family protein
MAFSPAPAVVLAACASFVLSVAGEDKPFRFPGGDPERGREAFARLNCVSCHQVTGVDLPPPKGKRRLDLILAEAPRFVRNYQSLVIAVTNPQHVVDEQYGELFSQAGSSKGIEATMPDFRNDMSVRQFMDILAFLDRAYAGSKVEYESGAP